ncbi:MAG: glycosyltransferase [Chloroflexi bacterium]|nr:glycosyltransferase [Chloroflexota bacterium]
MSENTLATFVVVTYKRPDFLPRCLESIQKQGYRPLEVIVVDNGDDVDPSVLNGLKAAGVDARLLRPGANLGPGQGRNLGMQQASGDIAVFVDDDAVIHQDNVVEQVRQIFATHPRCAGITGYSQTPDGQTGGVDVPYPVRRQAQAVDLTEVPYLITVMAAVRIDAALAVGGFPAYQYCMEEYDFSLKLIAAEYSILYNRHMAVTHHKTRKQGHTARHIARGALPCSINRVHSAFRLLPFPVNWSMIGTRLLRLLLLSRVDLKLAADYLSALWHERQTILAERRPIGWATVWRLIRLGGWTMFV